jgi:hypothetical protein
MGCVNGSLMEFAHDCVQCRALVLDVSNFRFCNHKMRAYLLFSPKLTRLWAGLAVGLNLLSSGCRLLYRGGKVVGA